MDHNNIFYKGLSAQHVFSEDNAVYLKKKAGSNTLDTISTEEEEWFPVNFQWIPVVELQRNLMHESKSILSK